jgi:hypothetical protein
MPENPNKRPCSHPGCRAWAMRNSDPPLCSYHAGRTLQPGPGKTIGPPEGNANALTHGFYSRILRDPYTGEPLDDPDVVSLDDEIAITRVALRRILAMLLSGTTPGERPRPLDALDYARLGGLAFQGARTVARLLKTKEEIGAGDGGILAEAIDRVLDDLSEEWGVEL